MRVFISGLLFPSVALTFSHVNASQARSLQLPAAQHVPIAPAGTYGPHGVPAPFPNTGVSLMLWMLAST
jgi:hypothetical protein